MSSPILTTIQSQLIVYGISSFTILGNIGNAFIIILFRRQLKNACSLYLFSAAIVNVLYLIYGTYPLFPVNYNDETPGAFVLCKANIYISSILGQVPKTLFVLACIDRFLITSNRVTIRAWSTVKRAKYLIFFSVIFWSSLNVHIPILTTIVHGQCGRFGIYSTIFTLYGIIFIGLLPPITSGIFGYLTYRNMRQLRNRVQPIGDNTDHTNTAIRRRDRDLIKLVISEVIIYVITAGPFPLILLEMMISQYILPHKSIQYLQIEGFVFNIANLLLFGNSAVPFYVYLIVSKPFRNDFKQLIMNVYRKLRRQPIAPVASTVNGT